MGESPEIVTSWVTKEYEKCKNNPYYFATTYCTVKSSDGKILPYKTALSEAEFNELFLNLNGREAN